jgi:hypothetical protein
MYLKSVVRFRCKVREMGDSVQMAFYSALEIIYLVMKSPYLS